VETFTPVPLILPTPAHQVSDISPKSFCNTLKHSDRRIALTPFDAAEIGLVDVCPVSKLLL